MVRARKNTSMEPKSTAAAVRKNAVQVPNSRPPAMALMLLGMGASTTDKNWNRKKTRWE